ncbi:MAG: hypothetical protein P8I91_00260 [Phycisphaerales bacterium]|nr:hypothetical protein [Phycisphaerales bacterium]
MRSECKLLVSMVTIAYLSGCGLTARTSIESPASHQYPADADSLDFWDTLEAQPVTTNDDALHGLLLLVQQNPPTETWESRLTAAQTKGWIGEKTTLEPNESAQMGMIAVCLCHILDVQGGLSMRMFGRIPRYSTRELVHIGLIPGITEHEALSGAEFIALLGAAEQRQSIDHALAVRNASAAVAEPVADAPGPDAPEAEPTPDTPSDQAPTTEEGDTTS